ncbi:MAG: DUF721 domain-containing protein [Acidimicrobiia bacterium]|nr:DUF721 domain-containing protein [Acidimicrobiia bacterium]
MNDLSSLLPGFLRQLHFSDELTGEFVMALWEQAVGEAVARNARPQWMRNSILVLTVSSEAWKKELFSLRFEILRKLERLFGTSKIARLEFRVDPWMTTAGASAPEPPLAGPEEEPASLLLDSIDDPELQRRLAAAASSYFGRETKPG